MKTSIQTFLADSHGATAIEYGLIASLIAVALVAILAATGTQMSTVFSEICSAIR